MFKWKSDKSRAKAEFRLEFKATQVPHDGWDKLCVSLTQPETGKIIARTQKVSIVQGACIWEDPISETVRLELDPKTEKYYGKPYKLIVSSGSALYGFLGDTDFNLAHYVGRPTPLVISLPLKNCISGCILHVTIQQTKSLTRDRDMQRDNSDRLHNVINEATEDEPADIRRSSPSTTYSHSSEGTTLKEHLNTGSPEFLIGNTGSNGNHRHIANMDSNSFSSSGSSYSDKQERPGATEFYLKKGEIQQDAVSFLSSLSAQSKLARTVNDGQSPTYGRHTETKSNGWAHNRNSNQTIEFVYKDNERMKAKIKDFELTIEELRSDVSSLERRDAHRGREMDSLKRQLAKEIKQGKDLEREISSLKDERDNLQTEVEQFKSIRHDDEKVADRIPHDKGNSKHIIEEFKQELDYEKQLNLDLSHQLQKTQESNSELLLAVQDLEIMLEEKEKETNKISSKLSYASNNGQDDQNRPFEDVETECLEKFSAAEDILSDLLKSTSADNTAGSLNLMRKSITTLETLFLDAKQDLTTVIYELKKGVNKDASLDAELKSCLKHLLQKISSYKITQDHLENQEHDLMHQSVSLLGDEVLDGYDHSKCNGVSNMLSMQEMVSQVDVAWTQVVDDNQKLQEEINNLSHQLKMIDEEAQALANDNARLEGKVETLEVHLEELQNQSNAGEETFQQMDRDCNGEMVLSLQEENGQLVNRISVMESQLKKLQEKQKSSQSSADTNDAVFKMQTRIVQLTEEANDYKKARDVLVKEIEKMEEEYEELRQEHENCSSKETEDLYNELQHLKDQNSNSQSTISNLEWKIGELQQEIDLKTEKFSKDLDTFLQSKREQEEKVKQAEEALKKTRWENAAAAERCEENFKKLSQQMTSAFEEKDKITLQALEEAKELCLVKADLQDAVTRAEDDIVSIKKSHEQNLQELKTQLDQSRKECEELSMNLKDTSEELEKQRRDGIQFTKENEQLLSEISMLRVKVEALTNNKHELSEYVQRYEELQVELKSTKNKLDECIKQKLQMDATLHRANEDIFKSKEEIKSLQGNLVSLEKETDYLKSYADEKERAVQTLEHRLKEKVSQMSAYEETAADFSELKNQHLELQHMLLQKDQELEDLKEKISSLQREFQQKVTEVEDLDRKLKDEVSKARLAGSPAKNASNVSRGLPSRSNKEVNELRRKLKVLEDEVEAKTEEIEQAREEFCKREADLKMKISQLEEIDKNRDKIEDELDNLRQQNAQLLQHERDIQSNVALQENLRKELEKMQKENKHQSNEILTLKGELETALEETEIQKKHLQSALKKLESELIRNQTQMEELKKINSDMEDELRDMHERYTEMSLRFAELEGERQVLIKQVLSSKK